MLKKIAFIMGLIGSALELLPNLLSAVKLLIDGGIYFTSIDTFSPLIYSGGMILFSAAALIGCLIIFKKRKLSGILLCASGSLMLAFSALTYAIFPFLSFLLLIAAGVLALVDKDAEDTDKTVNTL